MTIRDDGLRERYVRSIAVCDEMQTLDPELKPIAALMDSYSVLSLLDGPESPSAKEAVEHLVSPELRTALRKWYSDFGQDMNPTACEFRDRLRKLSGESFV